MQCSADLVTEPLTRKVSLGESSATIRLWFKSRWSKIGWKYMSTDLGSDLGLIDIQLQSI